MSLLNSLCEQHFKEVVNKSAIATVGVTIKDKYLIKCMRVNMKYQADCFHKMFPDRAEREFVVVRK